MSDSGVLSLADQKALEKSFDAELLTADEILEKAQRKQRDNREFLFESLRRSTLAKADEDSVRRGARPRTSLSTPALPTLPLQGAPSSRRNELEKLRNGDDVAKWRAQDKLARWKEETNPGSPSLRMVLKIDDTTSQMLLRRKEAEEIRRKAIEKAAGRAETVTPTVESGNFPRHRSPSQSVQSGGQDEVDSLADAIAAWDELVLEHLESPAFKRSGYDRRNGRLSSGARPSGRPRSGVSSVPSSAGAMNAPRMTRRASKAF